MDSLESEKNKFVIIFEIVEYESHTAELIRLSFLLQMTTNIFLAFFCYIFAKNYLGKDFFRLNCILLIVT
jgi:hypothetical protein